MILLSLGTGRERILSQSRKIGMMGYGAHQNQVQYKLSDLYVRAWAAQTQLTNLDEADSLLIFANAEICFVTQALQQAIFKALQAKYPDLQERQLVLSAQHTHAAPSGYSHHMLYNLTTPGFQPEVFAAIVKAFVGAISQALETLQPASLDFAKAAFPADQEVAFNRALKAYNANPENEPLLPTQTHLAIDRNMYLLRAQSGGQTVMVSNWFGVHATSLDNDNTGISGDNKGLAAIELERHLLAEQGQAAVCLFAQAAAGDVSPNFYGEGKNWPRGKFDSDLESARFNGRLQARQARRILEQADFQALSPRLDSELLYHDLGNILCDPAFTGGREDCYTAPPAHGVSFLEGTLVDGKGISPALAKVVAGISQAQTLLQQKILAKKDPEAYQQFVSERQRQAPKVVAVESGRRRFLGFSELSKLPLPAALDPVLGQLRGLAKNQAINEHSWTPQILPIQLACIGELALIVFPGEITTTAARRLRATVLAILARRGVTETVICAYSNAYSGYCTTPEEYDLQGYEGGHTVFGRWTLAAFQTLYSRLAEAMLKPASERDLDRSLQAPIFSESELSKRSGGHW